MNLSVIKKTVLITAASFFLSSCNDSDHQLKEAKNDVNNAEIDLVKAQEDYLIEVANFKRESNLKIEANEQLIIDLKAESQNSKKEIRIEQEKQYEALHQQNIALKTKLQEFKENSKENWENFKMEFGADMDSLGEALKGFTTKNN